MSAAQQSNGRLELGSAANGLFVASAAVGVLGLAAALVMGAALDHGWDHFFRSYLFAFCAVVAVCLGGLFFTMLQHATRAGWSVVLRRISEIVAANLQWIWILFIPVLLSIWFGHQYHWMHPVGDHLLEHKAPFFFGPGVIETNAGESSMNYHVPWFWILRAVVVLAIWAVLSRFYFRTSVAQDATGDVNLTHRMQWWAPVGLLLYALTQSIAAIDWIESLEAHWFSTMFAVYFFAASCCAFFAVMPLIMFGLQRSGRVTDEITREHYQDAGKLLFAFGIVFWAYIAYSQYMLIWYANIPEETAWYMPRMLGGWRGFSLFLLVGHFVLPFLLLVTKHTKRAVAVLAVISVGMLIMHLVDIYWLVMPAIPFEAFDAYTDFPALQAAVEAGEVDVNFNPRVMDLACLLGVFGLVAAATIRRMTTCALIPRSDPRLNESLAFENF